jgi:hypothetical protein
MLRFDFKEKVRILLLARSREPALFVPATESRTTVASSLFMHSQLIPVSKMLKIYLDPSNLCLLPL